MVCHCLLIESERGLILVDTGFGTQDVKHPESLGISSHLFGWKRSLEGTALHQLKTLGFQAADVRHIVVTHLDLDHAGGLSDFPSAQVHCLKSEWQAANDRRGWQGKQRYRPSQLVHHPHWRLHEVSDGESWQGFQRVREIPGIPPEILLIPLPGHSLGHLGIAVGLEGESWLLHAGDSYYDRLELYNPKQLSFGLKYLRHTIHADRKLAWENQKQLHHLIENHKNIRVFCSHDPSELRAFT